MILRKLAARWSAAGAEYLHVVDLDGALAGAGRNLPAIQKSPGVRFYASAGRRRNQKSGSCSRIAGTGGSAV